MNTPGCVLFEDEHLLVVNKPAGWNTHAPSPYAGEGIYDWLKHREPHWAALAILHRLDKETSGVIVFGKTPQANRSLMRQFTERRIRKKYLLLTDRAPKQRTISARSKIVRTGDRYASGATGELAETRFEIRNPKSEIRDPATCSVRRCCEVVAEPLTGRTHQIRVHAAECGFPILGDKRYGGSAWPRVCLHATELSLQHPATGEVMTFTAPPDFEADAPRALRDAVIDHSRTDAFRIVHGASDGWPGWYLERLGDFLLSQSVTPLSEAQLTYLANVGSAGNARARGAYHKPLSRHLRGAGVKENSPQLVLGEPAPERFAIRENGVKFELSFTVGCSVGLFLDQRDNRRRLLTGHVAAGFALPEGQTPRRLQMSSSRHSYQQGDRHDASPALLNCFAYTCGFSVCAALAGAHTTSLDLSKKYLDWGKRNFVLNGLDPAGHDFIYGDTFDWFKRFAKRDRSFDMIILDPPTFSQSTASGAFRAGQDYGRLVAGALRVLKPDGILFCSTNAADWLPEEFVATIERAVRGAKRKITRQHFAPQPPDFPVSREEPAHLKTVWLRVS